MYLILGYPQLFKALSALLGLFAFASVSTHSFAEAVGAKVVTPMSANVVFMRHALAPGFGDPNNFNLDDCATQRNLNEEGREQARFLGKKLRAAGWQFDQILSSRWCRCAQTADQLGYDSWQYFDGLNSFFQNHVDREKTLQLLEQKLDSIGPEELILMVSHQVVISAITGISPESGGLVLYNTQTKEAAKISL